MTSEEFGSIVQTNAFKDKLESTLKGDYPDHQSKAEDVIQTAMLRAAMRADKFVNAGHVWEWLRHTTIRGMNDAIRKEKGRRKAVKRTLKVITARGHDPYKHLDWRIDLERGIRTVSSGVRMQSALWMNVYEGWEMEETSVKAGVTLRSLERYKAGLNKEMRRKGYKGV